jgi:hypothetical protein
MNSNDSDVTNELLRAIISLLGRQIFPPDELRKIVSKGDRSGKMTDAYNLCDGLNDQGGICKKLGLDRGNFNRTIARWETAGILFRIGRKKGHRLLHLYPLVEKEE